MRLPVIRRLEASGLSWLDAFGVELRWERYCRRVYPVRFFLFHGLFGYYLRPGVWLRWLRDARWWLVHRLVPRHRYHLVNTGLPPGYYDPDTRMLHACFSLFARWWEQCGRDWIVWDTDEWRVNAAAVYAELYAWWQTFEETDDNYEEATAMLVKLVSNRGPIWHP